jgi:hypothetical protein
VFVLKAPRAVPGRLKQNFTDLIARSDIVGDEIDEISMNYIGAIDRLAFKNGKGDLCICHSFSTWKSIFRRDQSQYNLYDALASRRNYRDEFPMADSADTSCFRL